MHTRALGPCAGAPRGARRDFGIRAAARRAAAREAPRRQAARTQNDKGADASTRRREEADIERARAMCAMRTTRGARASSARAQEGISGIWARSGARRRDGRTRARGSAKTRPRAQTRASARLELDLRRARGTRRDDGDGDAPAPQGAHARIFGIGASWRRAARVAATRGERRAGDGDARRSAREAARAKTRASARASGAKSAAAAAATSTTTAAPPPEQAENTQTAHLTGERASAERERRSGNTPKSFPRTYES